MNRHEQNREIISPHEKNSSNHRKLHGGNPKPSPCINSIMAQLLAAQRHPP